jgi:hypothetical protein
MLTVYVCVAALVAVACTGARLSRLAHLRIRHAWLLWTALADQVLIISVIPNNHPALLATAHIGSYVAAGACLLANRRLPGAWLIGAGGLSNGLVIVVNGGTLPRLGRSAASLGLAAEHRPLQQLGGAPTPATAPARRHLRHPTMAPRPRRVQPRRHGDLAGSRLVPLAHLPAEPARPAPTWPSRPGRSGCPTDRRVV